MSAPKRVRVGRGWHPLKVGMLKQHGDQVREAPRSWVPIHPSEYGREIGVNELPHRRPNDPPSGFPDRVYLDNPPGDDPATVHIDSDREDSAERMFESVSVILISEAVAERRGIINRHPPASGPTLTKSLLALGLRLADDLEAARRMTENAAEIAYPAPTQKADDLPKVAV